MAKFERWILLTIKFGAPVSLVLFPLMALYGHLRPWAFAEPVLSTYSSQTPVMVGFSHRANYSLNRSTVVDSRIYILFPSVLHSPKTIVIRKVNDDPPTVAESEYGFIVYLGWFASALICTWWFWLRQQDRNAA